MRKAHVWIAIMMALPLTALAGKQERDLMTKKVMPAVKEMQAKYKASCGCDLAVNVDEENLKTRDEIWTAKAMADNIAEGVEKYCTDGASKKAMCQLKQLTLTKGKPVGFTFKDGKGVATTDGQMSCAFEQITKVLDK